MGVVVDKKRKKIEAEQKRVALEEKKAANLKKKLAQEKVAEKVKAKSPEDTFVTQDPILRDALCNKGKFHVCGITINDNGKADFTFFESKKLIEGFLKEGGE